MDNFTEYEKGQLACIQKWEATEPSIVAKVGNVVFKPVGWTLNKIIPRKLIEGALTSANSLGSALANKGDILSEANVESIESLRNVDLKICDDLANGVHNWALGIAGVEGCAAGVAGALGIVVDIPSLITLAYRTVHKIGLCYGYECSSPEDKMFVNMVMSIASANTVKEKVVSLVGLQQIRVLIAKTTFKKMAEKAAQDKFSKEAFVIFLRKFADSLGRHLTKRKMMQAIPFIGAAVGAGMNTAYIQDVAWAARRCFQKRWLEDNGIILIK